MQFFSEAVDDLIAHAEAEFELGRAAESGGTLRDEYLSIQRQTGRPHPALQTPPCPPGLDYLLAWFSELSSTRSSNGFGHNPISYAEIMAWATLTRRLPSGLEVEAIRRLDVAYLKTLAKRG